MSSGTPAPAPNTLHQLWNDAGWPARLLFLALVALFVFRATYLMNTVSDRIGFLQIGAAALTRGVDGDWAINTYPPPFALAMAPLAALQHLVGDVPIRYLWGSAQLLALGYFTWANMRLLSLRPSLALIGLAWLASCRFIVGDLNSQNVSLLLAALVTWSLSRGAAGNEGESGFLLGIGASLKIWPGFGLASRPSWRLVAGAALGVGTALAATWAVLGGATFRKAVALWLSIPTHRRTDVLQNQAYRGLLARLGGPALAGDWFRLTCLSLALGLAILAPMLFILWRHPSPTIRGRTLDTWLVILALLPMLPLNWFNYYVVVLPLALAVLGGAHGLSRPERRLALGLLIAGALIGDLLDVSVVGPTLWSVAARYGNSLWGALLIGAAAFVVRGPWAREDAPRLASAAT
jgi:hypothetical protein